MSPLLDYQRAVAAAIISGNTGSATALISGHRQLADRLNIHRNTMLTALTNALALTYPAVLALVGEVFFHQMARTFVQVQPPHVALLNQYGNALADFLSGYEPVEALPYLPDVARLEWAVECASQAFGSTQSQVDVDLGGTRFALAPSLILLTTRYPAEAIWRAVLNRGEEALSRIDMTPVDTLLAIWLQGNSPAFAPLSNSAGAFLKKLLAGDDVETAIGAVVFADPGCDPVAVIVSEVLEAGFARLTQTHH